MRNAVKYITSWFLLVVLFVSTSGFTVYSHMCNMKMSVQSEPTANHFCCTKPVAESTEGHTAIALGQYPNSCCESKASFIKFNFTASQQTNNNQLLQTAFVYIIPTTFRETSCITTQAFSSSDHNLPPPRAGREILLKQDLLRI